MTILDDALVPAVSDLLTNIVGTDMTFTVPSGTFDPTTNSLSGESDDPKVWKASPPAPASIKYVETGVVQAGDLEIIVAASGITFTPVVNTKVEFDSTTWRVVHLDEIKSGDDTCAYVMHLRR